MVMSGFQIVTVGLHYLFVCVSLKGVNNKDPWKRYQISSRVEWVESSRVKK